MHAWSYPHPEHCEVSPRDNWDRQNRALRFPNVTVSHWGESYLGRRWIERELVVSCVEIEHYEGEAQIFETHSQIQLTHIVRQGE